MKTHSPVTLAVRRALALAALGAVVSLPLAHADTNYGPVRPGETLSDIVNEHYLVSPLSDQAIMQSIIRNNPGAFINNDPGRLRQGVTLSLPADPSIGRLQSGIDLDAVSRLVASQSTRPAPRTEANTPSPSNTSELNTLRQDLTQLRRERDSLSDELRTLKQSSVDFQSKLQALETESRQANRQLLSTESSLKTARDQLQQAEAKTADALEAAATAQAQVEALESAAEAAKTNTQKPISDDADPITDTPVDGISGIASESDSDTIADPETQVTEGRRIQQLERTVRELQTQKERELADLRDAIAEKTSIQEAMEGNLNDLDETVRRYEAEIFELKTQNTVLSDQLGVTPSVTNAAPTDSLAPASISTSASAGAVITQSTAFDPFSVRSVDDLKQSVNVPLWGLLLGALALALTSLMMLFGRKSRRDEIIPIPIPPTINDEPAELVFRTGASQLQDPDVESLRVPPRRDASRVAVLDPSTIASTSTKTSDDETSETSGLTTEKLQEGRLKLAMAEAYLELEDEQAATELLQEVRAEGSSEQIASANKLLSRLA